MKSDYSTDYTDLVTRIKAHLANGGQVQITTYLRSTIYDSRHVDYFKVGADGSPLVRSGRRFDDFRYTSVRFSVIKPEFPVYYDAQGNEHSEF